MARLLIQSFAPDFTATSWDGKQIQLADYRGKRIWLAFFRYAACPLCNLRVHAMIQRYPEFEKSGLAILTVFQSSQKSVSKYVGKQRPPFPLLCDPKEELYALYGLEASLAGLMHPKNIPLAMKAAALGFLPGTPDGTTTRLPADFLIGTDGKVHTAWYAETIGEHIPLGAVGQFLLNEPAEQR